MKAIYLLRSLLFYFGYLSAIGVFSLLGCTVGWLLPMRQRQTLVTTANQLIVPWLCLCCGVKLKVEGLENIPSEPFVALSKHQSSWETYYLQRTLRPVSTILKRELLRIPVFGWGLATTAPIAINRDNPRQALRDVMEQGKDRLLNKKMNVLVYPEGTRVSPGNTRKFNRSGAALAIAAGVPVLPICHNAGTCWPAHRIIKYPGTIHVVFGKAIDPKGYDSKALTDEVRNWMDVALKNLP
ncbi:MAG: lysophospholipid acyltransferase family protein [Porticoccaceae bacterium]